MKSGSRFEEAKPPYVHVLEDYIIEPIATGCLDVSSLRQALDVIKQIHGKVVY